MKLLNKTTLRIALVVLGLLQLGWGISVLRAQDCALATCDEIYVQQTYCVSGCQGCCGNGQCCCVWWGQCTGSGSNGIIQQCCSGCGPPPPPG